MTEGTDRVMVTSIPIQPKLRLVFGCKNQKNLILNVPNTRRRVRLANEVNRTLTPGIIIIPGEQEASLTDATVTERVYESKWPAVRTRTGSNISRSRSEFHCRPLSVSAQIIIF